MKEFLSVLLFAVAPAYAAPEVVQWGSDTGSRYELWDVMQETGLSSEEKWATLTQQERSVLLDSAGSACRRAEEAVAAALKGTDADTVLKVQRKSLAEAATCLPARSADAEAAAARQETLRRIEAAAKAGKLSQADLDWLKANNIHRAQTEEDKLTALKVLDKNKETEARLKKASKKQTAVSAMSAKGASGLSEMYDKSAAGAERSKGAPEVDLKKGQFHAKLSGPRGSTAASIGHEPPPAPAGAASGKPKLPQVKRDFKSPFPEEDLKALDRAVQAKKEERLKNNYTLGSLGNIRQMIKLAPKSEDRGDGPGSGCRDWGEAVAKAINTDPALKGKYEAGVICGAKVPYLSQHCVTVFHRKGADVNDPKTDVWYYDAWRKKTESGPIDQQLCRFPVPLEQDYTEGPIGQKTTSKHHISYYEMNKTGEESVTRKVSSAQTNVLFKRGCFD